MYSSAIGLPSILISFKTQASTAMIRSSRGVVSLILNDESLTDEDGTVFYKVSEASDIPATLSDSNKDLIKKCLLGTPAQVNIFAIPMSERTVESEVTVETTTTITEEVDEFGEGDEPVTVIETRTVPTTTTITSNVTVAATITLADALKQAGDIPANYIAYPTGNAAGQEDLATWVKAQRNNKHKTFKAVVAHVAADDMGVTNFTTEKICTVNEDYTDALAEVGGDATKVPADIPQYKTYSAAQYTARIAGLLAGLSLDRSSTYYTLPEIVDCQKYDEIENHINEGEFCLFDEHDSEGVKVARAINSLVTFTANVGDTFRFIKIVEALDMIRDDVSSTFKRDYCGKVINSYSNKALLISAINIYLKSLEGEILDSSAENYVEIDTQANAEYAKMKSIDTTGFSESQLQALNTGEYVFLRGSITPVNSMENLQLEFTLQ